MRVVSLTCSNTEIVCALGCEDMLVGVDSYSDYPPSVVSALPRLGPDLKIDVDRVKALSPDLVLASLTVPGHERVVERIRRAGLNFIAPDPTSLADVHRDIHEIARLLGVPERGERLVSALREEIPAPTSAAARIRVLVEWWPKPVIVPGRESWVTELIAAAGGENPFASEARASLPVNPEAVVERAVDAVVISWCGVEPDRYRPEKVYERDGWASVPAVRRRRVYCVPEAHLGRPGPRLVEGFRALQAVIRECADDPRSETP